MYTDLPKPARVFMMPESDKTGILSEDMSLTMSVDNIIAISGVLASDSEEFDHIGDADFAEHLRRIVGEINRQVAIRTDGTVS